VTSTKPEEPQRPPRPEVWLRGPVAGVPTALQPVAHALLQTREDLERATMGLSAEELWRRPGGAASVGFHLRHVAGSADRLFTYARGEPLSASQRRALEREKEPTPGQGIEDLLAELAATLDRCLEALRRTPVESLAEPREVGRARLPSTVGGLLFHAAEHAQRHTGQVIATVRILRETGLWEPREGSRSP
jgi:uncharacterized damage-inducible protein DinB